MKALLRKRSVRDLALPHPLDALRFSDLIRACMPVHCLTIRLQTSTLLSESIRLYSQPVPACQVCHGAACHSLRRGFDLARHGQG